MKLVRHVKKKRTVTISMSEEELRSMYDTLFYTIYGRHGDDSVKEYADKFVKIWNEVCKNFKVDKE